MYGPMCKDIVCRPRAKVKVLGPCRGSERTCSLDSRGEVVLGDGRSLRESITWRIPEFMCMLYTCISYIVNTLE